MMWDKKGQPPPDHPLSLQYPLVQAREGVSYLLYLYGGRGGRKGYPRHLATRGRLDFKLLCRVREDSIELGLLEVPRMDGTIPRSLAFWPRSPRFPFIDQRAVDEE